MCFFPIATKYNEPLAAVKPDSDDDRYDVVGRRILLCPLVGRGAAGQPTLDLSDQLRSCSIGSTTTVRVGVQIASNISPPGIMIDRRCTTNVDSVSPMKWRA